MPLQTLPDWDGKISNHAQVGGIETSVLDNGAGRGTRIAWINTGTGLRYKVLIDRAMDIADAFFNQYSLVWLSHSGITSPQPFSDKGIDWLRTFGGGLLTTCGLSHVGGPEKDAYGERGLHGEISNTPAEIISIIQPDPANGKLDMSITGVIRSSVIFGPCFELRRTISGKIGSASITIHDEVFNRGNTAAPHMLLYHCNFGWPLVDEETDILWKGEWKPRFEKPDNIIFTEKNNFRKCLPPIKEHSGNGEEVGIIDIDSDAEGKCVCGLYNSKINLALSMRFHKKQLPWLVNWQHWGKGEYVTGIEPSTHPLNGQAKAREEKTLLFIPPGEKRNYDLEIEILSDTGRIKHFLKEFDTEW
ncbi:MAG TPA: aldose 1-epimerase family protein [Puia sp.]|nr:aldose 1-epimerase family protein [Puia sp.]